jgi:16S rRNA (cytosine1402-N4)-methyltransferase
MRMDTDAELAAAEVVNEWSEEDLGQAIRDLGEEQRWRAVARAIVAGRPWADTAALAAGVGRAVGRSDSRINPATRTFQAIRMVVNDELGELDRLLTLLPDRLKSGGRAAIIAFHSLEDRAVKQFFARESARGTERDPWGRPVTPPRLSAPSRPMKPAEDDPNPRARSARLRSARRLPWPTP